MLLRSIRRLSTKPPHLQTPTTLHNNTADDSGYAELNNFYSELFTESELIRSDKPQGSTIDSELEELNREMSELYGVDIDTEPLQQSQAPPPLSTTSSDISILDKLQSTSPLIIRSKSNNPFFNLALEDKIFELTPRPTVVSPDSINATNRLVFYINKPTVVIGKNQNPFKETSIPLLSSLGIPLLRRFSGGGTVVHDLGNVNYSYMTGRQAFLRGAFNGEIVSTVNKYVAENGKLGDRRLRVNGRGDIVMVDGGEETEYKVSGSAYRISKGKAYHHGTMLLDSNLKMLRELLKKNDRINELRDSSVDSVRSKVRNVGLQSEEFMDLVSCAFKNMINKDDDDDLEMEGLFQDSSNVNVETLEISEDHIDELTLLPTIEKLKSWDWSIGGTPIFEITYSGSSMNKITFQIKKNGVIESFKVNDEWENEFELLKLGIESGEKILFKGDVVAGFIMNDEISSWVANVIDGSEV